MTRSVKVLFVLSATLLILSYPACQLGEKKVDAEMAKYPASFVEAHYFDLMFGKWVMPGIWMLNSGLLFGLIAVFLWIVGRKRIK